MKPRAYLAGPDVFLPDAPSHAARKVAICARHGIDGRPPLNEDLASLGTLPAEEAWATLYRKDIGMMDGCDLVIANLTPFRGVSADSGTLVEIGWFLGRGRPVFGYSNSAAPFSERCRQHGSVLPDPIPGVTVEGFGLPDNLMIEGALVQAGGHPMLIPPDGRDRPFDSLDMFEACVALAARRLGLA
ncbi:nucleoside 2-deoxyribosyltransferase [Teichococcus oryzae]|uniref:Nucleoside 2-deoxyribosyltransferase n=1 Tax=Teichococcus oryzae TaxID=1608942 RepID=A0A5B2TL64_9PROT|nr:nucleoside 2-deoxyribosyltransferase [Pseudoroseomonas oryzae]KAA2215106.1 nucleoside 2-deoxyribosyltransferase [Pseudoroseomonas oryzae]